MNGIVNPAQDRVTQRVLDSDNRLVYSIDALGFVEKNDYDALGHLTRTTRFAEAVPAGTPTTLTGSRRRWPRMPPGLTSGR